MSGPVHERWRYTSGYVAAVCVIWLIGHNAGWL